MSYLSVGLALLAAVPFARADLCPVNACLRGRENIEWSVGYGFHYTDDRRNLPRVLLIGDSICNGYKDDVQRRLGRRMNVSYWASSYCVSHPGYPTLLGFYLAQAKYDVVHFNNGCHSFGTPIEDWKRGFRAALKMIRERQPQARIVWAATTPNRNDAKNERVKLLNAAALSVIAEFGGIATNDLYAAMDKLDPAHRSGRYWRDDYHFSPAGIAEQGRLVSAVCTEGFLL